MKALDNIVIGVFILILNLIPLGLHGQASSVYEQGKQAFMADRPGEAIVLFEEARKQGVASEDLFLYLGLAYLQNGNPLKGEEAFLAGRALGGAKRHQLNFNLGNLYLASAQYDKAVEVYQQLIEAGTPYAAQARLNKANAELKAGLKDEAVADYTLYLSVEPDSPQADTIRELIALLRREKEQAAEQARLAAERAAEEARLEEERQRLEAERQALEAQRLAEERARQEALLNDILSSLEETSSSTTNLSAGEESVTVEEEESSLDDID